MSKTKINISVPATTVFYIFAILKVAHVIDWSWWWVTCPLWAPLAGLLLVGLAGILTVLVVWAVSAVFDR